MDKTKIGLFRVVVIILTACLGVRWLPVAGGVGPSAIIFWLVGGLMFLLPLSVIVLELTYNYQDNGGIYLWVRKSLGVKFGFLTAWMYWVNNFFFYPALLVFMVANFAYLIGVPALASNKQFVMVCVIISLWIAIYINTRGIKLVTDISIGSCILNVSLGAFIICAGVLWYWHSGVSATSFTASEFIPNANLLQNLSTLTLLMFALSGIELVPTIIKSIHNPKLTLKRGMIISTIIIMLTYIVGSLAINLILSPDQLTNTTGLMEALEVISVKIGLPFLAKILILFLLLVEIGALIVWILAPTVMFFECADEGVIPDWLKKENKYQVPANALYMIGVLVTIIVFLTQYLPSVNTIFTTLVLMGSVVYFIPYLFMIIGYLKLKLTRQLSVNIISISTSVILSLLLFAAIVLGICLSFVPSSELIQAHDVLVYELELVGGVLLFTLSGIALYWYRMRRV